MTSIIYATEPAPSTAGRRNAVTRLLSSLFSVPTRWGLLLIAGFAVLYGLTLDDGLRPHELMGGDLITHQYAQVQGRPSNAPGYPLYTMGGWLWFRMGRALFSAPSNPIPLLSSYSTLWALIALWLMYRLVLEVTSREGDAGNVWIALLVTAFFGLTYFFWYYAVTTEQYTSAVAWTLAVLLLAFRWERTSHDRYLLGIAFLCGVALAHMVTTLVIIPPLLWFVLRRDPRLLRRPRLIAVTLGLAFLPLLSYIYVYLRGAAHPEWRGVGEWTTAWQWFRSFISTSQGWGEMTWSWQPIFTPEFPSLIVGEMGWIGLLAGLFGWLALGRRRALVMYASMVIYVVFCWIDRQGNWYQVIMPLYALLALGIAAVAGAAWRWSRGRKPLQAGLLIALLCLVAWRGAVSYPRADSSGRPDDTALVPGWVIVADQPPQDSAILGTLQESLAIGYLANIWGVRPDLHPVTSDQARELLRAGGAVMTTVSALPLVATEVDPDAHYSAWGAELVAVRAEPSFDLPAGLHAWQHDFDSELAIAGGFVSEPEPGRFDVRLAWQAKTSIEEDWSVSVRLSAGGTEIGQIDRQDPVAGTYPTHRWVPGEIVMDVYSLTVPEGQAPDSLTVIVYRKLADGQFENLDVARFSL